VAQPLVIVIVSDVIDHIHIEAKINAVEQKITAIR
jgi:hypothetical protein